MTIVLLKIQSDRNSSENLYLSWRGNHPASSNRLEAKYDQNYTQSRQKIFEIHCCLNFEPELNPLIKMAIILPTGQWYAPSAVVNDAWYCMVLSGIPWYCMVLYCIAWCCMVLHNIAWHHMVLHGIAWYCMAWHGIALYYKVLHGIAWYCMVLHGIAW